MMDKETFCLVVDGMIKQYDKENEIYYLLKKYDIYVDIEVQPINSMLEKLIEKNFNKIQSQIIFGYTYPIEEREEITPEELYDEIIRIK